MEPASLDSMEPDDHSADSKPSTRKVNHPSITRIPRPQPPCIWGASGQAWLTDLRIRIAQRTGPRTTTACNRCRRKRARCDGEFYNLEPRRLRNTGEFRTGPSIRTEQCTSWTDPCSSARRETRVRALRQSRSRVSSKSRNALRNRAFAATGAVELTAHSPLRRVSNSMNSEWTAESESPALLSSVPRRRADTPAARKTDRTPNRSYKRCSSASTHSKRNLQLSPETLPLPPPVPPRSKRLVLRRRSTPTAGRASSGRPCRSRPLRPNQPVPTSVPIMLAHCRRCSRRLAIAAVVAGQVLLRRERWSRPVRPIPPTADQSRMETAPRGASCRALSCPIGAAR